MAAERHEEDEEVNNAANDLEGDDDGKAQSGLKSLGEDTKKDNGNDGNTETNDDEEEEEEEEDDDDEDDDENDDEQSDSDSDSDSSASSSGEEGDDDNDKNDETNNGLSQYELLRLERIKRNKERLIQLGLESKEEGGGVLGRKKKKPPVQRRKSNEIYNAQPTRKSRRSLEPKSYVEPSLRLGGILPTETKSAATAKKPPSVSQEEAADRPTPRKKPSRLDLRPTRIIYDEFQSIRRHKKQTLKQAHMHLRQAEKEVKYWHRKVTIAQKKSRRNKQNTSPKPSHQEKQLAKEKQLLGGLSAREFLDQLDQRHEEIETKIAQYDFHTLTAEQKMEVEAKRQEHQNQLKLLEAKDVVTQSLKVSEACFLLCFPVPCWTLTVEDG
jgi:hypothetical protein